jgi:hypothetical protein
MFCSSFQSRFLSVHLFGKQPISLLPRCEWHNGLIAYRSREKYFGRDTNRVILISNRILSVDCQPEAYMIRSHADVVGSLLRPAELLAAQKKFAARGTAGG